jgi:hypothetical protein
MDEFGDDPTADFLAREQAILGAEAALFGNPITQSSPIKNTAEPSVDQVVDTVVDDIFLPSEQIHQPVGVFSDFQPSFDSSPIAFDTSLPQSITQPSGPIVTSIPETVPEPQKSQALLYI